MNKINFNFEEHIINLGNIKHIPRNYEKIAKEYLEQTQGIKLIKCIESDLVKSEAGVPDYIYSINDKLFFIEIKSEGDSLRKKQIEWILNNQDKNTRVAYFKVNYNYIGIPKGRIEKIEEKITELNVTDTHVFNFIKESEGVSEEKIITKIKCMYDEEIIKKSLEKLKRNGEIFEDNDKLIKAI